VLEKQFRELIKVKKHDINVWIRGKFIKLALDLVERLKPVAKDKLKDDEMCQFV
jgi:hypothetical protein